MNKITKSFFTIAITVSSTLAYADQTAAGKIITTEGHKIPNCRRVIHKENASGVERTFRIKGVAGDDDIQNVALTAITTGKNTIIQWTNELTSGCGSEPMIERIQILAD